MAFHPTEADSNGAFGTRWLVRIAVVGVITAALALALSVSGGLRYATAAFAPSGGKGSKGKQAR